MKRIGLVILALMVTFAFVAAPFTDCAFAKKKREKYGVDQRALDWKGKDSVLKSIEKINGD